MSHPLRVLALAVSIAGAAAQESKPASRPEPVVSLGFQELQNGLAWRVVDVPRCPQVCVLLQVRCGFDHDPAGATGLAYAVEHTLRIAQERWPEDERLKVEARGPFSILYATVPVAKLEALLARVATMLQGGPELDDDTVARALAAVQLAIDDETRVYPGPMLLHRARRAMFAGTPSGKQSVGVPAEVAKLDRAALGRRLGACLRPRSARLIVMGGEAERGARFVRDRLAGLEPGPEPPAPTVHDSAGPIPATSEHDTVDAPFVTLAFAAPAPDTTAWIPYLIAFEVIKARAAVTLGMPRQGEVNARFPYWHFPFFVGEPLVLINRRGQNGDDVETTKKEIAAVIERLQLGVEGEELGSAAYHAAMMLRLPPYEPDLLTLLAQQPGMLFGRAVVLAAAAHWGWPPDLAPGVARTMSGHVQQALGGIGDRQRWRWFAVVPKARASGR